LKLDWTNGIYLDGPRTAGWLDGWIRKRYDLSPWEGLRLHSGDEVIRAMHEWRTTKRKPTVWALDRHLTRMGGHILEIPDDLWTHNTPQRRATEEFKAAVVAETAEPGAVVAHVARRHGLPSKSVRNWIRWAQERVPQ